MKINMRNLAIVCVIFLSITMFAHAADDSQFLQNGFQALMYHSLQIERILPSLDAIGSAIEEFERAVDEGTTAGEAHLMLGLVFQNMGQFDQAIAQYVSFAEQYPDERWVHAMIGDIYFSLGQDQLAEEAYRQANAVDDYARSLFGLGNLAYKWSDYADAQEAYEQALVDAPDFIGARIGLGKAQYSLGKWEEAVETLEIAQLQNPRSAEVHHYLALTYEALGQTEQAEHARERVVELMAP